MYPLTLNFPDPEEQQSQVRETIPRGQKQSIYWKRLENERRLAKIHELKKMLREEEKQKKPDAKKIARINVIIEEQWHIYRDQEKTIEMLEHNPKFEAQIKLEAEKRRLLNETGSKQR